MTAHIFISFARSDGREFAEHLEKDLQAAGFTTWLDNRDIGEYRDFTAELEQAIEQATVVIVCLTPAANSNSFVRREIQYALLSDKRIIPLRFADVRPPIHIINRTWIDFYVQSWDQSLDTLIQRLKLSSETFDAP